MTDTHTLVCFALPDEARFFKRSPAASRVRVLVHGIGRQNAEREFRTALNNARPNLVYTCGFAGALDPQLALGDVVFAPESFHLPTAIFPLRERLFTAGAKEVEIHCTDRVAVTALEKKSLRQQTRADAVEMESGIIHSVCREQGIPCVTLRVISDTADEDLPLDFNALAKPDQSLDFGKLALAIIKSPGKIPALMRLGKNSSEAAKRLAEVLAKVVEGQGS